jgi:hypothetical protein
MDFQGCNMNLKSVTELSISDIKSVPIWQYSNDDSDELRVKPVKKIPVKNLFGKVVATQVKLANGMLFWAIIGNVDIANQVLTEHFLTLSIYNNHEWFNLARYHDLNYNENGPIALSKFLDMRLDDIFPISYDIRSLVVGKPPFLDGLIHKESVNKLSRDEIIALAVP